MLRSPNSKNDPWYIKLAYAAGAKNSSQAILITLTICGLMIAFSVWTYHKLFVKSDMPEPLDPLLLQEMERRTNTR